MFDMNTCIYLCHEITGNEQEKRNNKSLEIFQEWVKTDAVIKLCRLEPDRSSTWLFTVFCRFLG